MVDWHEKRHELKPEDIFFDCEGDLLKLDRTVPGDGSKWYVAVWRNGSWGYYDDTVEPGCLRYKVNTV